MTLKGQTLSNVKSCCGFCPSGVLGVSRTVRSQSVPLRNDAKSTYLALAAWIPVSVIFCHGNALTVVNNLFGTSTKMHYTSRKLSPT